MVYNESFFKCRVGKGEGRSRVMPGDAPEVSQTKHLIILRNQESELITKVRLSSKYIIVFSHYSD